MGEGETVTAKCSHCGGEMAREVRSRFSPGFGIAFLILGILFSLFVSLLLGLPMVVIGAYLAWASKHVWRCPECEALVDRAEGN